MRQFNLHSLSLKSLPRGFFSVVFAGFFFGFTLAAQAAGTGLLWQIESPEGQVSYVFGTIHSDDPRVNDFSPGLLAALAKSEAFIMETLPASDPSIYLMPDTNLRDLLNEKELAQVHTLADFHSMQEEMAMRMKPWLLAMVFDLPKPQSPYTQDAQLQALAESQAKEVLGLEDTVEHFEVLDSFSLEDQLVMLRAVLKRSQNDKERDFEALLKFYVQGDSAKIAALDDKITSRILPRELWSRMRKKLIDTRNDRMAERIQAIAAKRPVFIAVGASHLPGEHGLLELLQKSGYKLKPLKQAPL